MLIFATGGTIAGYAASQDQATNYAAGSLGVATLILGKFCPSSIEESCLTVPTSAVPEMLNITNIDGVQISNVASGDITDAIVLRMSQLANYALCGPASNYSGLVITHGMFDAQLLIFVRSSDAFPAGTDTLEETAFAMDISVNCNKPVVIVGAMWVTPQAIAT